MIAETSPAQVQTIYRSNLERLRQDFSQTVYPWMMDKIKAGTAIVIEGP